MQTLVDGSHGEDLRIEARSHPGAHLLKVFMFRIDKDFEQVGVPARAAAVFRRAAASTTYEPRIRCARSAGNDVSKRMSCSQ